MTGHSPMRRITTIALGLLELVRLGIITRFRLKGRYWTWRLHTAMGDGPKPGRGEMIFMAIEYAAWARRMRKG